MIFGRTSTAVLWTRNRQWRGPRPVINWLGCRGCWRTRHRNTAWKSHVWRWRISRLSMLFSTPVWTRRPENQVRYYLYHGIITLYITKFYCFPKIMEKCVRLISLLNPLYLCLYRLARPACSAKREYGEGEGLYARSVPRVQLDPGEEPDTS